MFKVWLGWEFPNMNDDSVLYDTLGLFFEIKELLALEFIAYICWKNLISFRIESLDLKLIFTADLREIVDIPFPI